jgi:hypothetical protein
VAALLNLGRAGGAATGYVLRDDTQTFITGLGHMAGNPDEKKRVMTHTCWFASWNLCMWEVPRHPSARGQVNPATLLHVLSQELHRSHVCPGSAAAERHPCFFVQYVALKGLLAQSPVARLALDAVPGPRTYEFAQMMGMLAFMVSAPAPLHGGCVQNLQPCCCH